MATFKKQPAIIFLLISALIVFSAAIVAKSMTYSTTPRQVVSHSDFEKVSTETYTPPLPVTFFNTLVLGIDDHGLADVIMVFSYNLFNNHVVITSIPRDTYVEEQNWAKKGYGNSQLCFAHYAAMGSEQNDYHNGAAYTAYWVEKLFNIIIHEYVVITYETFVELVDLIGGIEVHVDPAFGEVVPTFDKVIKEPLPTGLQLLDGEQVLTYARYRGVDDDTRISEPGSDSADGDRIRRNQRLIIAAYEQVKTLRLNEIISIARKAPDLVHTSYSVWDLTSLAPELFKVDLSKIETIVIPGETIQVFEEEIAEEIYYYIIDYEKSSLLLSEYGLSVE